MHSGVRSNRNRSRIELRGAGWEVDYAATLLYSLGVVAERADANSSPHPAERWAASGAMALTGFADGPALVCPAPLASCAAGATLALEALAADAFSGMDGTALLGERAAIAGLSRNGTTTPGGAGWLLPTKTGLVAINLTRAEDWDLLPACLAVDVVPNRGALAQAVSARSRDDILERAQILGLAIAPELEPRPCAWFQHREKSRRVPAKHTPLVIDLSSLWAGPLATYLLQRAGARVIKIESTTRFDGARRGSPEFFDLLNAGKESVVLDFATKRGRDQLRRLLSCADVVLEASRPRALRQLGIAAEELVKARPGLIWISLTGYGRAEPEANWIAFGDDAGVAAGLSHIMCAAHGRSCFCGDAIADPLTGLHVALAALAAQRTGQGGLFSIALRDVVAHCSLFRPPMEGWHVRASKWNSHLAREGIEAVPPRARQVHTKAASLGSDTDRVLREFAC